MKRLTNGAKLFLFDLVIVLCVCSVSFYQLTVGATL